MSKELTVEYNSSFTLTDFNFAWYGPDWMYLQFTGGPVNEEEFYPRVINNLNSCGHFGDMNFSEVTSDEDRIGQVSVDVSKRHYSIEDLRKFGFEIHDCS